MVKMEKDGRVAQVKLSAKRNWIILDKIEVVFQILLQLAKGDEVILAAFAQRRAHFEQYWSIFRQLYDVNIVWNDDTSVELLQLEVDDFCNAQRLISNGALSNYFLDLANGSVAFQLKRCNLAHLMNQGLESNMGKIQAFGQKRSCYSVSGRKLGFSPYCSPAPGSLDAPDCSTSAEMPQTHWSNPKTSYFNQTSIQQYLLGGGSR
jgi:hypothetical protein